MTLLGSQLTLLRYNFDDERWNTLRSRVTLVWSSVTVKDGEVLSECQGWGGIERVFKMGRY